MFAQLLKDVEEHEYAVSCGEIGHPSLLRSLAANGRSDWSRRSTSRRKSQGTAYQIAKGMTTLTEAWDASPISLNHFMMGHLMEWLYADLAGHSARSECPGLPRGDHPRPQSPGVTWAKASYDSISGRIVASWRIESGVLTMDIEIPANSTATVWVPSADRRAISFGDGQDATFLRTGRQSHRLPRPQRPLPHRRKDVTETLGNRGNSSFPFGSAATCRAFSEREAGGARRRQVALPKAATGRRTPKGRRLLSSGR